MKYNIPTIATNDLNVAEASQIGAETTVLASYAEFVSVGNISLLAPGSGTLNPDNTFIPSAGLDMQLVCHDGIPSAVQAIIQLNVKFADNSTGTATAQFNGPEGGWAENQTENLPQGLATDLTGDDANTGKQIKSIQGIASITGGSTSARFDIVALPDSSTWFNISCAMNKEPTLPVAKSHPIRCGYNPSRFVKRIPGDPGKLQLTTKRRSYGDGLERLNGHRVSIMLVHQKDGYLLTERQVFGGLRFNAQPKFPDADAEAEVTAESFFESFAVFI